MASVPRCPAGACRCWSCATPPSASSSGSTWPAARRGCWARTLDEEVVHAVDHVDLAVMPREVVGLVGESGCGKSTLGRLAVGLHTLSSGSRLWKGVDLGAQPAAGARSAAGDPDDLPGSVRVAQPPDAGHRHRRRGAGRAWADRGAEQADYVADLLTRVGLDASLVRRFPHQFSGGQRARIGIARALAVKPRVPGLRRGRRGARRLDPGAGAEPVHPAARRARPHLPVHQPRPRRGAAPVGPGGDHVPRAGGRVGAVGGAVRARPTIPIRRRCSPRRRRSRSARRPSSRSRARSRRRCTRPRAAISIRAARMRIRCPASAAAPRRRRCRRWRRGTIPPAT